MSGARRGQDAKKRGEAWVGPDYLASVVPPVLNALVDADARVRYYACEALYNIAKARAWQQLQQPAFPYVRSVISQPLASPLPRPSVLRSSALEPPC
jgi:hypothetical protein